MRNEFKLSFSISNYQLDKFKVFEVKGDLKTVFQKALHLCNT